jgi:hypothetical protein
MGTAAHDRLVEIMTGGSVAERFDNLLWDLSRRMIIHDQAAAEAQKLDSRVRELIDALDEDVDIDLPLDDQPQALCLSAMDLYLTQSRLEQTQGVVDDVEGVDLGTENQFGKRKVLVTALMPEVFPITSARRSENGDIYRTGETAIRRVGKVYSLDLNVMHGGSLILRGGLGQFYEASPLVLVESAESYRPIFQVTEPR